MRSGPPTPLERLNRELKRRTDVVGIFSNAESVIRLVGALLVEINDEMIAADRLYIAAASVAVLLDDDTELTLNPPLGFRSDRGGRVESLGRARGDAVAWPPARRRSWTRMCTCRRARTWSG